MSTQETTTDTLPNGAAAAAFLAAGIGATALALLTVLGRYAGFSPPDLYPPVGALTGKVGIALLTWLIAWGVLHFRWNRRQVDLGKIFLATVIQAVLGLLGTSVLFLLG